MTGCRSWRPVYAAGAAVFLAAMPMPAAHADRQWIKFSSGAKVEADVIQGDFTNGVHAEGKVVLTGTTGTQGTLWADRVDVTPTKPAARSSRSSVQEARATGHVRISSQPKPDERMEATGTAGTYWPGTQKATLTGGVTVTMATPQLLEPAVLTGARADIDLAKRSAEVTRTEAAQVTLRLRLKASASSTGSSTTGPARLDADRILMENAANRVTATGAPVMTSDQGTVHAERIWFDVDPQAKAIKMVHAAGSVRIDTQDPQRGSFHGTADEAVLSMDADTVVLTGNVRGIRTVPDEPEPTDLHSDELIYNTKTGAFEMHSVSGQRSRVTFKPKPKAAGAAAGAPASGTTRGRPPH